MIWIVLLVCIQPCLIGALGLILMDAVGDFLGIVEQDYRLEMSQCQNHLERVLTPPAVVLAAIQFLWILGIGTVCAVIRGCFGMK